jgi:hypothetical protein
MDFKGKLSQYFFSNRITYFFLVILIEIFILKTTMYHKYTLKYQKFTKKIIKKRYYRLNIGGISAQCHMLLFVICSFVFPATLIWLLHCNAMHFDSFSLGGVIFFM